MKKWINVTSAVLLLLGLATVSLAVGPLPEYVGPVYDGPELDYQPSIIRVEPGGDLMMVYERLSLPSFFGDFYVTFSSDNGQTWSPPQAVIASALNERHPSLLQLGINSFVLFYLVDETGSGSYRIHRATSSDGLAWTDQGTIDLGWITAGEINPNVIREADGTLTMTYHRFSGPSYIAQSTNDGVTWDTLQTQISPANAQLPRLTKRESDGLYLVTYQVGGSDLDLYAKVSTDPYDWSGTQIPVSTDVNTHDSQPIVLEGGTFLVTYAKTPVYYFDVFYRTSCDGVNWSDEVQVTNDSSRYDTQPHPLLHGTPGNFILTWSHQDSTDPYEDHDVWVNNELVIPSASDLSASTKVVEPAVIKPGDTLTYTLLIANESEGCGWTVVQLNDPIPEGALFQEGSLWASGGAYGYDPVYEAITWTGAISASAQVTVTFRVSTSASLEDGDVVTNTAWLTDGQGTGYTLVATATADAQPPISTILDPQHGQFISDTTYLAGGVAADAISGVDAVEVSVDSGPWQAASGQESWTFSWAGYADGAHNLRSQAIDALGHVEDAGVGITVTVDTTPPDLIAASPVSGAVDVPLSTTVILTFSEPIVTGTLAYSITPDPGGHSALWNEEGMVAYLFHDAFEVGRVYTVTLSQARDRALNPVAPVQWSFTTEAGEEPLYRVYLPVVLKDISSQ